MKHPQTVTVYPEKNENKAAYLLWRSLRAALLTAGALIALMVIWNVDLKGLFVLPLGGAVTVLLGCIAGDYLGAKKNIYRAAAAVPWLVFLPVCFVTGNPLSGGMSWVNRLITRWNAAHEGGAALLPTTDLAGDIIAFTLLLTMLRAAADAVLLPFIALYGCSSGLSARHSVRLQRRFCCAACSASIPPAKLLTARCTPV